MKIQTNIDGICYSLNPMDCTAEVTQNKEQYAGAINIPEQVTHDGASYRVTSIGAEAFNFCRSLTAITIPNSVVTIGNLAFSNCTALSEITIPDSVETIKAGAFSLCEALCSITLPKHMKCIGHLAFYRCAMESIVIPDGVTELERVFVLCKELKSVTIPQSVQRLGAAFAGCGGEKCEVCQTGAPAKAQRSGFGGERRSSGVSKFCPKGETRDTKLATTR